MATLLWIGNAKAVTQIDHLKPAGVEPGDVFTATINGKGVSYEAVAGDGAAEVCTGLAAAMAASTEPEFLEVTAEAGTDDDGDDVVIVTGNTPGKPFTLTGGATDGGTFDVEVETITAGSAGVNEKQRIRFAGTPTGGTFDLTFSGQTAAAIAYDADAATLQTALEALSNIDPGDVAVTGSAADWTVEFDGQYAGVNVPLMTVDGTSLTGGNTIAHATTTQGSTGTAEVQTITFGGTNSASQSQLEFDDSTTGINFTTSLIGRYFTAQQVADDFNARLPAGAFVEVEKEGEFPDDEVFTITFRGTLEGIDLDAMTVASTFVGDAPTIATTTNGSSTGVDEVQTITLTTAPTGGTWTISFQGQTTGNLDFDISAADLATALEALSNVDDVTVTRSGSGTTASPYKYTITFVDPGDQDVSQMTSDASSLTGMGMSVVVTQTAIATANEVQRVTLDSGVAGGTFTLTYDGQTTGNVAYNATAAALTTALEALSNIGAGEVSVVGSNPWTVTFQSGLGSQDVAEMTGNGGNLTGSGSQSLTQSTETAATGPNFADNVKNYSTGALPVDGDTLIFESCDVDCLYNLNGLSAVTLTALYIHQSYTGKIGLPVRTGAFGQGYHEYRPTYLAVGATSVFIGQGEGAGSGRIKLNVAAVACTLLMEGSGSPEDSALPAVIWKGTDSGNTVTVNKGSFGAAVFGGETATIATLKIGYHTDRLSDATVYLGSGCTLTTITKTGGVLEVNSNVTTLTNVDGDCTITAGAITTLVIRGGTVYYNSAGTLTTASVANNGVLDFSQDMRTKTVTNPIDVYDDQADVKDPNQVVTTLIVDWNGFGDGKALNIGRNVRITRGAPA